MLFLGTPQITENWLRQLFNQHPKDSHTLTEICKSYTDWRQSQEIPTSRFELFMIKPVISYLLDYVLHEEGFIKRKQRSKRSHYLYSKR